MDPAALSPAYPREKWLRKRTQVKLRVRAGSAAYGLALVRWSCPGVGVVRKFIQGALATVSTHGAGTLAETNPGPQEQLLRVRLLKIRHQSPARGRRAL